MARLELLEAVKAVLDLYDSNQIQPHYAADIDDIWECFGNLRKEYEAQCHD